MRRWNDEDGPSGLLHSLLGQGIHSRAAEGAVVVEFNMVRHGSFLVRYSTRHSSR